MRPLIDTLTPPTFERPHPLTDSPILLNDGSTISAEKLAQRFYDSELGRAMPAQPLRYEARYGYNREEMKFDLGHDVCPVGHQMELAYHLGVLLQAEIDNATLYGNLDESDMGILLFTSLVHDVGETTHSSIAEAGLTPVGDIPAGKKTATDRSNEAAVRAYIWQTLYNDVDPETIQRIESIIAHTDNSLLHDYFEAAHAVQSLETSNFAYYALMREQWHKNGEIIDISSDNGMRMSGLLGIARIPYESLKDELKAYTHFEYVRRVAAEAEQLRNPKHKLLNTLYYEY